MRPMTIPLEVTAPREATAQFDSNERDATRDKGKGLFMTGNYDKALSAYESNLAREEASLGPDHPDVATTLCDIGGVYRDGYTNYPLALRMYERALAIRVKAFGPVHPDVAAADEAVRACKDALVPDSQSMFTKWKKSLKENCGAFGICLLCCFAPLFCCGACLIACVAGTCEKCTECCKQSE
eukprot:Opistho-2@4527